MATRIVDPLFNLASYARPGPGRRDHLTPAQTQQIARTVGRTPEVMVKVLPRGANDRGAVRRHLDYIGRKGDVDLETDDGQTLRGAHVGTDLLEDWDLELDALRSRADLVSRPRQQAPRLVHKLMLWRVDLDESARRSGWEIGDRGGLSMPVLFVAGKG